MKKRAPGSYFFFSDWLGDTAVQSCSFAAKGIWFDMLAVMDSMSPRGVIPDIETFWKIRGYTGEIGRLVAAQHAKEILELKVAGVYSMGSDMQGGLPETAIVNRRMYRDWLRSCDLSAKRTLAAKKRWNDAACKSMQTACKTMQKSTSGHANGYAKSPDVSTGYDANGMQRPCKRYADPNLTLLNIGENDSKFTLGGGSVNEPGASPSAGHNQAHKPPTNGTPGTRQPSAMADILGSLHVTVSDGVQTTQQAGSTSGAHDSTYYVSLLCQTTKDDAFSMSKHSDRIRRILEAPGGRVELDMLVGKLENPTKHTPPIQRPGPFASSALVKLEKELCR